MNTSTVTSFQKGMSNSGMLKYVSANLACGHVGYVTLKPYQGTCWTCKKLLTANEQGQFDKCECGTHSCIITFSPDHHNENDYITKIGDVIACSTCDRIAKDIEWLQQLDTKQVHHGRYNPRFGGSYYFYRLDPTSPSNFMLIGGVMANVPAIDEVMRERKVWGGVLSPTEAA